MVDLKKKRKAKGLSQKELARLTGISRSTIAMIEIKKRAPSVDTARRIAKKLDFDWFIFFE